MRRAGFPLLLTAAVLGATGAMFFPVRAVVPRGARAWSRAVDVGGRRRRELVVAPVQRTGELPLYVVLHGSDATPAHEERRTGLAPLAGEGRAVLVYPAGVGQSWNAGGGCCGEAAARRVDDVAFIRAVVADAVAHLRVDPRRVYLVGFSNGGKLALRLLGADPGLFAGVAVYAAVPTVPLPALGPPVPVLIAGGTSDPRTSWARITETAHFLARGDGGRPERQRPAPGVTVTTWQGRREVQLVAYDGRGHDWPEAADSPLPLARLIESFFAR